MSDTYPQIRISPEAEAHLNKLLLRVRKLRGYRVTKTTIASEAILLLPLPKNGKKATGEESAQVKEQA